MAVAHGIASESHTGTTGSVSEGSFSWTHTPQAAETRGVLVFTFVNAAADDALGVTYGGVALTAVPGGRAVNTGGDELGDCKAWFLGKNVPQGPQTVVVTRTNNANVMYAVAVTVTATANTGVHTAGIVLQQGSGDLTEQNVDDGSPIGEDSLRYAAANSGLNNTFADGGSSGSIATIDFGTRVIQACVETLAGQGSRPVGFDEVTVEDRAAVYLAIRQGQGVTAGTTLASDAFTRANETPLASPWVKVYAATSNFNLSGNTVVPDVAAGNRAWYRSGVAYSDDQYAQAKITVAGVTASTGVGVAVRASVIGLETYYGCIVNKAGTNNITVVRNVAGVGVVIANRTVTWVDGDVLRLEVQGSKLRVYQNGVQLGGDITDTLINAGVPGIVQSVLSGSLDDFEAGYFYTGPAGATVSGVPLFFFMVAGAPTQDEALTGVSSTGSVGTLVQSRTNTLTGTTSTGASGTATSTRTVALTGATSTGTSQSVALSRTIAVSGVDATGAVGTVTGEISGDVTRELTSTSATGSVGTLPPSLTLALSSVSTTGAVGTVSYTRALAGVSTTSAHGTLSPTTTTTLTGVAATEATGTLGVIVSGPVTRAISGVTSTASVGTFGFTKSGSLQLTTTAGVSATGTLAPVTTKALTGVPTTSAIGSLGTGRAITSVAATGDIGTLPVVRTLALDGIGSTGAVGNLGVGEVIVPVTPLSGTFEPTTSLVGSAVTASDMTGTTVDETELVGAF